MSVTTAFSSVLKRKAHKIRAKQNVKQKLWTCFYLQGPGRVLKSLKQATVGGVRAGCDEQIRVGC